MDIRALVSREHIAEAAVLAAEAHRTARDHFPELPIHTLEEFTGRIGWIRENGRVLGAYDGSRLAAFSGYFPIEDFRNAGPGAFTPDWCMGTAPGENPSPLLRCLIREILADLNKHAIRIHGAGVHAVRPDWKEVFDLSGYGRIVLDAARPREALEKELSAFTLDPIPYTVRKAGPGDSAGLAALDSSLAAHIGASPVLMPRTMGHTPEQWSDWFGEPEAVAFMAFANEQPIGFIKAQEPQFDVSFTVHGPSTLAINGMFVEPGFRGRGIAMHLLKKLVSAAAETDRTIISVDCETMNPEAYGFWSRFFTPVTWSLERRF